MGNDSNIRMVITQLYIPGLVTNLYIPGLDELDPIQLEYAIELIKKSQTENIILNVYNLNGIYYETWGPGIFKLADDILVCNGMVARSYESLVVD